MQCAELLVNLLKYYSGWKSLLDFFTQITFELRVSWDILGLIGASIDLIKNTS